MKAASVNWASSTFDCSYEGLTIAAAARDQIDL